MEGNVPQFTLEPLGGDGCVSAWSPGFLLVTQSILDTELALAG